MGTGKRILRNLAFLLCSRALMVAVSFLLIASISRYLGVHRFGHYSLILGLVQFAMSIPSSGMGIILVREIARDRERGARFLGHALITRSLLGGFIFLVSLLAVRIWHLPGSFALSLYLAVAWSMAQLSVELSQNVFLAYERTEFQTFLTTFNGLTTLLATLLAIRLDWGIPGIFGATAFTSFLAAQVGFWMACRRFCRPSFVPDVGEWLYLIRESIPVGLTTILKEAYFRIDTFILAAFRSPTEVGLYNGAYRLVQQMVPLASLVMRALFPVMSRLATGSRENLSALYEQMLKLFLLVSLPLATFVYMEAPALTHLVLGPRFSASASLLRWLSFPIATMLPSTLLVFTLVAIGRQVWASRCLFACVVVNTLADFVMIPSLGARGACFGTLAGEAVFCTFAYYVVSRELRPLNLIRVLTKPVILSGLMAVTLHFLEGRALWIAAPAALLTYLTGAVVLRPVTQRDRNNLRSLLQGDRRPEGESWIAEAV
ncbi:MAG: flippase [Armatimonadetes bacterium]|nr:flippase [Armatimonadota bacterium]